MMESRFDPADFMASVEALERHGLRAGLEAGLVAAAWHGLAQDSRSFARRFAVPHALALRAVAMAQAEGLLAVGRRDARTQRLYWELTDAGRALAEHAVGKPKQGLRP